MPPRNSDFLTSKSDLMTIIFVVSIGCMAFLMGVNRRERKYSAWERSRRMYKRLTNR
jgi:hypothetical protein